MRFDGGEFFIFVIFVVIACKIAPNEKYRRAIVLISSLVFCFYTSKISVMLLIVEILLTYSFARVLIYGKTTLKKILMYMYISIIIGILIYAKYFTYETKLIGISFFSLESIGLIVELYKGNITNILSFYDIAQYLSFFPTITSGPIKNSSTFFRDYLNKNHSIKWDNIVDGFQIILMGLIKKKVVADHLAIGVNVVYNAPLAFDTASVWLAVVGYSLQIYFDFSGYSDMAIGFGKILGYDLPRNFNFPFLAENPSDFWNRWHISLSSWLKQYVYYPLGGSRCGKVRTYVNLFIIMVISGVWHGNGLTFIVWGIWHGIGNIVHRYYKTHCTLHVARPIRILMTYLFVMIGWIPFRSKSLNQAGNIVHRMFVYSPGIHYMYIQSILTIFVVIIATIYISLCCDSNGHYLYANWNKISNWIVFWICTFICFTFYYIGDTSFIYAQF